MVKNFEHRTEELLPLRQFLRRMARHGVLAFCLVAVGLFIGMLGYHLTEGLSWLDSALNAAMLLGGMGPVDTLHTTAGKLFAICYALFAGIVFLVAAGVLFAPPIHRFLHRFHLEQDDGDGDGQGK